MSKFLKALHVIGHGVWVAAQYVNVASDFVPPRYKPMVAAGVGLVQAVHGYYVGTQSSR